MQPDITSVAPRRVSFNPRPALRPGDAKGQRLGLNLVGLVSIRARP